MQDHANPGGADNQPTGAIPDDAQLPDNTDRQQAEIEATREREAIACEKLTGDAWFRERAQWILQSNGDPDEQLAEVSNILKTWAFKKRNDLPAAERDERQGWQFISLDDLRALRLPPVEYVVQDVFVRNGLTLLAGPPKAGKSRLARSLSHAVSGEAERFLGKSVNRRGAVLNLSLEDDPKLAQQHYDQMGTPGERITLVKEPWNTQDNRLELLQQAIHDTGAVLTIIDTFIEFDNTAGGLKTNEYAPVTEAVRPLRQIARRLDTHILVLHHDTKAGGVMGSRAFTAVPDTYLTLKEDGDGDNKRIILSGKCRSAPPFDDVYLAENEDGFVDMDQAVWQARARSLRGEILGVLHEDGEAGAEAIQAATGRRGADVRSQLKKMVQDGDVSCRKDPDTPQKMLYSIGTSSG